MKELSDFDKFYGVKQDYSLDSPLLDLNIYLKKILKTKTLKQLKNVITETQKELDCIIKERSMFFEENFTDILEEMHTLTEVL